MQGVARLQGEGPSGPSPFSFPLSRRDPAGHGSAFPSADRGGTALRGPSARPPAPSRAAVAGRPPLGGAGPGEGDGAALFAVRASFLLEMCIEVSLNEFNRPEIE